MHQGLEKLYGYTSDEQGVRHSLLDQGQSNVGQDEAVFMLGACASFASYLWRKGLGCAIVNRRGNPCGCPVRGCRHSLLDQGQSNVGQDEAVFMLGACASFASYLWRKGWACRRES